VTPLSTDERRALALLAALLLLASAARWLERPRNILDDAPEIDVAALEQDSRAAKDERDVAPRRVRTRSTTRMPADSLDDVASRQTSGRPSSPPKQPTAPADSAPIDLNTATAEQLQRISGIGPAIARRLILRRDSLGRFASYDDVDRIPGVGPALLARIQAASVIR